MDYGIVTSAAGIPSVKIGQVIADVIDPTTEASNTQPVSTPHPASTPPLAAESSINNIIIVASVLSSIAFIVGCCLLALCVRKRKHQKIGCAQDDLRGDGEVTSNAEECTVNVIPQQSTAGGSDIAITDLD